MASFVAVQSPAEYVAYQPVPAISRGSNTVDGGPLPIFGAVGTGGESSVAFFLARREGYPAFAIVLSNEQDTSKRNPPFVALMEEIKAGFGRTMSSIPEVFGVSRQTLYNWLAGETPKEQHHAKLQELAAAARVFSSLGFKPSSAMLDKTLAQGKSFLQLISGGVSGEDTANRLIRILNRGSDSRDKLREIVGARKPARLEVADMGAPHADEKS